MANWWDNTGRLGNRFKTLKNRLLWNEPTPADKNVKEGNYKISRPFLLVNKKDTLTQNGQNLIDFILSSEGQQIVSDNKLITID